MLCDENIRLSAKEVLQHNWLNDNEEEKKEKLVLDNFNKEKLKLYQNIPKLKKNILSLIVSKCCNQDIENLKNIFNQLDLTNCGNLSFEEFKKGLIKLTIENIEKDIQNIFETIEVDCSDKINYIEFLIICINLKNYLTEEKLHDNCKLIDKNNNGKISKNELKEILNNHIDKKVIDKIILDFDLNGEGLIDYNQFLNELQLS